MPAISDILQFVQGQLFELPKLPDTKFAGKTIAITGANTGLGLECAKQVAKLDAAAIVLGVRNISAGETAKQRILESCTGDQYPTIHVWHLDLAAYASVIAFADRMRTELDRCDALIANAGISTNQFSLAEGLERTLTVNVVSTFLLSMLVLPQLDRTAKEYETKAHLSIVGSNVHCFADHSQLQGGHTDLFKRLSQSTDADMGARYFLSKLIVMLCVRELAARYGRLAEKEGAKSTNVIINCPSPGWCKTDLFRQDDGGFMGRNMLRLIGRKAEVGGRTLTSAIAANLASQGQYLSECRPKPASVFVRSKEGQLVQRRVWAELLSVVETVSPQAAQGLY